MTAHTTLALTRWVCHPYGHETWTRTTTLTACAHIRGGKPCTGIVALAPERRSPALQGGKRTRTTPTPSKTAERNTAPTTEGAP